MDHVITGRVPGGNAIFLDLCKFGASIAAKMHTRFAHPAASFLSRLVLKFESKEGNLLGFPFNKDKVSHLLNQLEMLLAPFTKYLQNQNASVQQSPSQP